MLNQPTIEKLHAMKLNGMADAFRAQQEAPDMHPLSFEERFAGPSGEYVGASVLSPCGRLTAGK